MSLQTVRTRVGNYELGRTLREGTFAKVKFARNMVTGESFAIKVVDKEKVMQHKKIEQIKREISTMNLIKHPNVVQLHEVMASKTKIYIVLEFVTGGELFDKIVNHGRLTEDEARRYFQQLINVVDYCHSRGVYHRNLKPENLLLDSHGNLKVSEFGLSALPQQVGRDGLLHTTCGTPNYVAPEVINDKGYDGVTADLWSCGVILYVFVSGYLPFDETNLITLYKKISKADFTCPPYLSLSAKKLITRILDPNPKTGIAKREARFTSKHPAKEIISKIEEAARPLGFDVQKQNYKMKLQGAKVGRKGNLSISTEVFEVGPLFMVELHKAAGDTLEFHEFCKNFRPGLKDIVWSYDEEMEESK